MKWTKSVEEVILYAFCLFIVRKYSLEHQSAGERTVF